MNFGRSITSKISLSINLVIRLVLAIAVPSGYSIKTRVFGNLMILVPALFWLYKFFIKKWSINFQNLFLVKLENGYRKFLNFALAGAKPYLFLGGTF